RVRKYPPLTVAYSESGGGLLAYGASPRGYTGCWLRPSGGSGRRGEKTASVTPRSCASLGSRVGYKSTISASDLYFVRPSETQYVETPSGLQPGFTSLSDWNVRSNRPEPASTTSAMAICATTSAPRTRCCACPTLPRPPSRIDCDSCCR